MTEAGFDKGLPAAAVADGLEVFRDLGLAFAAVPENGFFETACATIVEIGFATADASRESDVP